MKHLISALLLVLCSCVASCTVKAQSRVDQYVETAFNGVFVDIDTASNPNNQVLAFGLPFQFSYDNIFWPAGTSMVAFASGVLTFDPSQSNLGPFLGNSQHPVAILLFQDDGYSTLASMFLRVTGSAPNRMLIVEWHHLSPGSPLVQTNIEVKLYESTNVIEFLYADHGYSLGPGEVGLNGANNPSFVWKASVNNGLSVTPSSDIRWTPTPCLNPITITSNPQPLNVCSGQSASFSVTATGNNLSYQWRHDATPIPAATTATYTIASPTTADAGSYDVIVGTGSCATQSSQATLFVRTLPSVTVQPSVAAICGGSPMTFSIVPSDTNGVSTWPFQWMLNGVAIPGATSSTYTTANPGAYSVVLTSPCGEVTSSMATLTVTNCISGRVFRDQNLNGSYDLGESLEAGLPIQVTGPPDNWVLTQADGTYSDAVGVGNFIAHGPIPPLYYTVSPVQSAPIVFVTPSGSASPNNDFVLTPIAGQPDLRVTLIGPSGARTGQSTSCVIEYDNVGTTTENATINFTYASGTNVISGPPGMTATGPNQVSVFLGTLLPGQHGQISITLFVSSPTGSALDFTADITVPPGELTLHDNVSTSPSIVVGPHDPNAKSVSDERLTPAEVAAETNLTYTIEFQNTGTASAINVIVKDALDPNLRTGTFHMISASHPYTVGFDQNGLLNWTFENINLPDSNADERGSHGYITYSILPERSLTVGAAIVNRAAIYFDLESPILTNKAITLIREPCTLPAIDEQPRSQTVCSGQIINLAFFVAGSADYQWFKDGNALSHENGPHFMAYAANGHYWATATTDCGTVTSSIAVITVLPPEPPQFAFQQEGLSACIGQSAQLITFAPGMGTLLTTNGGTTWDGTGATVMAQWYKDSIPIPGATSPIYSIPSVQQSDDGVYFMIATGCSQSTNSSAARLRVPRPLVIFQQPTNMAVTVGSQAIFSVYIGADDAGVTYQWRKNGTPIFGATGSGDTIHCVKPSDTGCYDVVVTGPCGSIASNRARLSIASALPTIAIVLNPKSLWPPNQKMQTITATITTTGSAPVQVQLVSITSNEVDPGQIGTFAAGTDTRSFWLKADRNGKGSGRIYTITYRVIDASGNTSLATATVTVPHDQGAAKLSGDAEDGQQGVSAPLQLSVYPNPVHNIAHINIEALPEGLPARVDVVNENGETIASLYDGIPSGELGLQLSLDCTRLASGTYYVHVQNAVMGRSVRLVISK